jgi:hypothetical protein
MGGGLMELVAKGSQDIYLTGNPQITFFKTIYKRHTNFSIESVEQTFKGDVNFGQKSTLTLSRKGDLVSDIIIELNIPKIESNVDNSTNITWANSLGHILLEEIELEIGGLLIDKQYGEWLEIWSELTISESQQSGYKTMVGNYGSGGGLIGPTTLYIPLQFWFCRNIGLALPLVALQYHEVSLNIKLRTLDECWVNNSLRYYKAYKVGNLVSKVKGDKFEEGDLTQEDGITPLGWPGDLHSDIGRKIYWPDGTHDTIVSVVSGGSSVIVNNSSGNKGSLENPLYNVYVSTDESPKKRYSLSNTRVFCDYIYLDTVERRKFAQIKHNYLIEQIQYNGDKTYIEGQTSEKIELGFNHPTKEIIWVQQSDLVKHNNDWFNFSASNDETQRSLEPISKVILYLNGQERFSERKGSYFRLVQPFQRHTRIPSSSDTKYIYTYSFCFKPEEHQPSGTCNFSRIDNADIHFEFRDVNANDENSPPMPSGKIKIYAINYNILRIQNGMGGLAYSN